MKVFISAIAVLLLLTSFVTFNVCYLCNYTDQLIKEVGSLPVSADNAETGRLIDLWLEKEGYVNLTVDHRTTDKIELALYHLQWSAELGEQYEYETNRRTLLVLLRDIKRSVSFSPNRIF